MNEGNKGHSHSIYFAQKDKIIEFDFSDANEG
jgi:hypothetical protein